MIDGALEVEATLKADSVNVQSNPKTNAENCQLRRNTTQPDNFDWHSLDVISFAGSRKAATFISSLVMLRNAVKKMLYRYGTRSAPAWWKHQAIRDVSYKVQRREHCCPRRIRST